MGSKIEICMCGCYKLGKEEGYKLGLQQKALASKEEGRKEILKEVNEKIDKIIDKNTKSFCNEIELEWIRTQLKQSLNQEEKKE